MCETKLSIVTCTKRKSNKIIGYEELHKMDPITSLRAWLSWIQHAFLSQIRKSNVPIISLTALISFI